MTRPGERDSRDLRDRLRELRVDPPEGDFGAALHRRLTAEAPPDAPPLWRRLWPSFAVEWRLLWPAAGLALGVALFLALGALRDRAVPVRAGRGGVAATELPATKVAMVRVNLSAEVAVASAQIKVSLPEGLVFWVDGQELAQRAFEWTQPLHAGDNDIPIAVRGLRAGHYRMTVTAQIGRERIEDEVLLEVVDG
jgi:hypothetical protein